MKASVKGILAVFAALSLVFLFFSAGPNLTAFFGLNASSTRSEADAAQSNNAVQSSETPAQQEESLGVGLSFKVLKKTAISASLGAGQAISDCPETTELELAIKNLGEFPAKKISLSFPPTLKVVACENCSIESLEPFQEAKARAKLCRQSLENAPIEVLSINAPGVKLLLPN